MVDKALANLEALRKPTAERSWTISEEVYQNLKSKLEASGGEFAKGSSQGTVIHGDAHPGNFFVDKNGKVSLIDVETAMESLNAAERGTASAASDVGRFVESIRINNKAKGLDLTQAEIASLETAFTKAYMRETGVNPKQFASQIEFYRAKMEVTVLKFAKTEGDFSTFLKTMAEQRPTGAPVPPLKAPIQAPRRSLSNPESLKGATPEEVRSLIPADWERGPMRTGRGEIFRVPGTKGADMIQLSEGNHGSPDALHQGPYIKIVTHGKTVRIPLEGNSDLKH